MNLETWPCWRILNTRCLSYSHDYRSASCWQQFRLNLEQISASQGVTLFWRTINKQIPTKDNLIARGVIPSDLILSSGGCVKEETINHLFFEWDFFNCIWQLVHRWLGITTVVPADIGCHAPQLFDAHAFRKDIRSCFQVVWLTCLLVIWKERNSRIFSNNVSSKDQLLDSIKLHSWWWLKTHKWNSF